MEMELLDGRVDASPLRQPSVWMASLAGMFANIAGKMKLSDNEAAALQEVPKLLLLPGYAQIISHLDLIFDGICARIRFVYTHDEVDEDNLDVALLEACGWEGNTFELLVCVTDAPYAAYLGADQLAGLSADRLQVRLVETEKDLSLDPSKDTSAAAGGTAANTDDEIAEKQLPSPPQSGEYETKTKGGESAGEADGGAVVGDDKADDMGHSYLEMLAREESHGNPGIRES